jgi:hypothetical protein
MNSLLLLGLEVLESNSNVDTCCTFLGRVDLYYFLIFATNACVGLLPCTSQSCELAPTLTCPSLSPN